MSFILFDMLAGSNSSSLLGLGSAAAMGHPTAETGDAQVFQNLLWGCGVGPSAEIGSPEAAEAALSGIGQTNLRGMVDELSSFAPESRAVFEQLAAEPDGEETLQFLLQVFRLADDASEGAMAETHWTGLEWPEPVAELLASELAPGSEPVTALASPINPAASELISRQLAAPIVDQAGKAVGDGLLPMANGDGLTGQKTSTAVAALLGAAQAKPGLTKVMPVADAAIKGADAVSAAAADAVPTTVADAAPAAVVDAVASEMTANPKLGESLAKLSLPIKGVNGLRPIAFAPTLGAGQTEQQSLLAKTIEQAFSETSSSGKGMTPGGASLDQVMLSSGSAALPAQQVAAELIQRLRIGARLASQATGAEGVRPVSSTDAETVLQGALPKAPTVGLSAMASVVQDLQQQGVPLDDVRVQGLVANLGQRLNLTQVDFSTVERVIDAAIASQDGKSSLFVPKLETVQAFARTEMLSGALPTMEQTPDFQALRASIIEQVRTQLTVGQLRQTGLQRMTLVLHPPELGRLDVQLELRGDSRMHATLIAETPMVREALQQQLSDLRQSLANQGFQSAEVEVQLGVEQQAWRQQEQNAKQSNDSAELDEAEELDRTIVEEQQLRAVLNARDGSRLSLFA